MFSLFISKRITAKRDVVPQHDEIQGKPENGEKRSRRRGRRRRGRFMKRGIACGMIKGRKAKTNLVSQQEAAVDSVKELHTQR